VLVGTARDVFGFAPAKGARLITVRYTQNGRHFENFLMCANV